MVRKSHPYQVSCSVNSCLSYVNHSIPKNSMWAIGWGDKTVLVEPKIKRGTILDPNGVVVLMLSLEGRSGILTKLFSPNWLGGHCLKKTVLVLSYWEQNIRLDPTGWTTKQWVAHLPLGEALKEQNILWLKVLAFKLVMEFY